MDEHCIAATPYAFPFFSCMAISFILFSDYWFWLVVLIATLSAFVLSVFCVLRMKLLLFVTCVLKLLLVSMLLVFSR